jgi:DNA-binding PucR family transcriptional regulator
VVVGTPPDSETDHVIDAISQAARAARYDVLTGVQGDRLVAILGGADDPLHAVRHLLRHFGPGPVVVGPVVADLLSAHGSAAAAVAGLRAVAAWPEAPRPVAADDLLPERALAGDPVARARLVEQVFRPLEAAGPALLETLSAYLEQAASLEAAARMLFVHPNTVRYRLRRVAEITGHAPSEGRHAFALRLAMAYGRLDGPADTPPPRTVCRDPPKARHAALSRATPLVHLA